ATWGPWSGAAVEPDAAVEGAVVVPVWAPAEPKRLAPSAPPSSAVPAMAPATSAFCAVFMDVSFVHPNASGSCTRSSRAGATFGAPGKTSGRRSQEPRELRHPAVGPAEQWLSINGRRPRNGGIVCGSNGRAELQASLATATVP